MSSPCCRPCLSRSFSPFRSFSCKASLRSHDVLDGPQHGLAAHCRLQLTDLGTGTQSAIQKIVNFTCIHSSFTCILRTHPWVIRVRFYYFMKVNHDYDVIYTTINLEIDWGKCKEERFLRKVEGKGKGKRKGDKRWGSEAFAETEKSPFPIAQSWSISRACWGCQVRFPAGALRFFHFCQSFTSHFPFSFPFVFPYPFPSLCREIKC